MFEKRIYNVITKLLKQPQAVTCKHSVILDLLDIIQREGTTVDIRLIEATINGDDEFAIKLLQEGV